MAQFTQNPEKTNDPSYLNYARDLDKPQVDKGRVAAARNEVLKADAKGELLKDIAPLIGPASRAVYGGIVENIRDDITEKVDAVRADFGVDDAEQATQRPAGLQEFETRLASVQGKYDTGGMRETDYYGRLQAITREAINKYPGFREEVDNIVKDVTGVNPANALRKSIQNDIEAAERKRQAAASADDRFVNQNLEYISPKTLKDYLEGKPVNMAQVKWEVAGRQRDKFEVEQARANLALRKDIREGGQDQAIEVASKEVSLFLRNNMTQLSESAGGEEGVLALARSKTPLNPQQQDELRVKFNELRLDWTTKLRGVLNQPEYDSIPGNRKQEIIENGMKQLGDLEKAITDKDIGQLNRTVNYLEAQKNADTRKFLEANQYFRKLDFLRRYGDTTVNTFLSDRQTGAMTKSVKAIRDLNAVELVTGSGTSMMDQHNRTRQLGAEVPDARNPQVHRQHVRDFAAIVSDPKNSPEVIVNAAKMGFGEGNAGFVENRFKPGSQMEVFATMGSAAVHKGMLRIKDSHPDIWNSYTKWMADTFKGQLTRSISDVNATIRDPSAYINISFDERTNQFVTSIRPGFQQNVRDMQMRGYDPLDVAKELNQGIKIIEPVVVANGGGTKEIIDLLVVSGVDPKAGKEPYFIEKIGQAIAKLWETYGSPEGKLGSPEKRP